MKLSEIIGNLNNVELYCDGKFEEINYCTSNTELDFLGFLENEKYISKMNDHMTCVICRKEVISILPANVEGILISEEPKTDWYRAYNYWAKQQKAIEKKYKTIIGKNCKISNLAYVAPNNVTIGDNTIVEPFCCIYENTVVGDSCILHAGTIVGGQSFSSARAMNGEVVNLIDLGKTIIEDNVEVCSNVHIANGILPTDITLLGEGTRLDAHIHIGHGTKLGKRVFIAAGAMVAGNCEIGNEVWIGVNATISNRIKIGDKARVSLGAVVTRDVSTAATVTGNFAINHEKFIQNLKRDR